MSCLSEYQHAVFAELCCLEQPERQHVPLSGLDIAACSYVDVASFRPNIMFGATVSVHDLCKDQRRWSHGQTTSMLDMPGCPVIHKSLQPDANCYQTHEDKACHAVQRGARLAAAFLASW